MLHQLGQIASALQAGGGGVKSNQHRQRDVYDKSFTLEPSVVKYIKDIADYISTVKDESHQAELLKFFRDVQKDGDRIPSDLGNDVHQTLLSYFSSSHVDILAPPPDNDLSFPLSSYFISSSHNTYLSGNQLYGDASVDAYTNVLLRGCRCVEVDVWNGRDADDTDQYASLEQHVVDSMRSRLHLHHQEPTRAPAPHTTGRSTEPRVLHGHTLTKEVSFREVCEAIRNTGFRASQLPVIVSLEVHANLQQQQVMIDIMNEEWQGLMIPVTKSPENVVLPNPGHLMGKILVKVKYSAPEAIKQQKAEGDLVHSQKPTNMGNEPDSGSEDENEYSQKTKTKKPKLLDSLSALGVYTRGYHFKGFDTPEAKIPIHVFSLSEVAVLEAHENHYDALLKHNQSFLMRAFPKSIRVTSTNLDPAPQWRNGVQMAALNWQTCDRSTMLNEGMFANTGGWMLKPPSYRVQNQMPRKIIKILNLSIELLAAQNLPVPRSTYSDTFHPYISCTLHVDSPTSAPNAQQKQSRLDRLMHLNQSDGAEDPTEIKRHSQPHTGTDPDFLRETLRFSAVPMLEETLSFLRFKVSNKAEMREDPLAAWACLRLDRVKEGFRMIRFFDAKSQQSDGVLFVRITKTLTAHE